MKITILDGNPEGIETQFDLYLKELTAKLELDGSQVSHFRLRDRNIRYCTGCFGCWVKTPGECVVSDDSAEICRSIIHSDFTLWASPLQMGFPGHLLKKMMDKSIPLIHPYFAVDHNEAHHRRRYENYPRFGLLLQKEQDTDSSDLSLVTDIFSRTAINMKSRLEFMHLADDPVEEVVNSILHAKPVIDMSTTGLKATIGETVPIPHKLVLFNGSPRGAKGNTPILLEQMQKGFLASPGRTAEIHHLVHVRDQENFTRAFSQADCVLLGFPLYTDAMPGIVKLFIEQLEPFRNREGNPSIGFLVQSGFPEASHSRHIERYLEKLAHRLGCPYVGTVVKGGGEAVRLMPDTSNKKLFTLLQTLGSNLAEEGRFNPVILQKLAKPEKYPVFLVPLFKLLLKLPLMNFYWDSQLKPNGVYERRFDQPYR